ncbi:MAG: enolase C-terminal domain-like protein [bacterium]|nr:enolase C-terminal domain-like protein [bacterium]
MRIVKFEIYVCEIPFKFPLKHALAENKLVLSLFVKAYCENGVVGFGETVPRYYVTQETIASEFSGIKQAAVLLVNTDFETVADLITALKQIRPFGAGQSGLELALLDAGGKYFKKTIPEMLGRKVYRTELEYSGAVMNGSLKRAVKFAFMMKKWGFKKVKVKVGLDHDMSVLKISRFILGKNVRLRIDTNGVWDPEVAIKKINAMQQRFNIEAAEQPSGLIRDPKNADKLKQVTDAVSVPVMADESLSTIESAEYLAENKCCDIFNIRISKHGGLLNALTIYDIAKEHGIGIQVGSQVGESGVLTAAGQIFASMVTEVMFAEGGGGRYLFPHPVIKEDLTPGTDGMTKLVSGPGLGITVDEDVLKQYTLQTEVVDMETIKEYQFVCGLLPKLYTK